MLDAENLEILEPITLSFQRGNILNDGITILGIEDAVAGLQYLAGMLDMDLDDGQVNVVNMASSLPDNKPGVKDVIALMQNLVGTWDNFFQLDG